MGISVPFVHGAIYNRFSYDVPHQQDPVRSFFKHRILARYLARANERGPLRVTAEDDAGAAASPEAVNALDDPEGGQNGEYKSGPVDKGRAALMVKDGEERPSDGNASSEVTFGRGEGVGSGGGLEEEEGEEDENLGENAGVVTMGVHTKGLERGDKDEERREAMPERERQMDPEFIVYVLGGVMLLDDVVDVGRSRANEKRQEERDDVMTTAPDVNVDGVQDDEEREAPADAVDDGLLAGREELIDDGAE